MVQVARLTAEWEGLVSEPARIGADHRKRREELLNVLTTDY
jgi:hypothetical protein